MSAAKVRAVLQLCRIPNVFTAMSNVVAGVVLARGGDFLMADVQVVGASALLYLAGMVLNDYFDRDVDAVERPERPIPSGRVSATAAFAFGSLLMVFAALLLRGVGEQVQLVGVGLTAAILAYDIALKNTPLGAPSMGLCRTLNVLLGFAVVPWPPAWMWVLPVGLGLYTAVITYLARDEVVGLAMDRSRASARMMLALFVVFLVFASVLTPAQQVTSFLFASPFIAMLGLRGFKLFSPLLQDASGPTVGRAIGGGILLMPGIDAAVLACAGYPLWALVALAFTLPALYLKRWYYLT
jgi:4-hydroxybenzoate polyprenyltransferase